jgi:predicted adenylyl cyclase CyaB
MVEIEVKIKVGSPGEAKRRLLAAGCVVEKERSVEADAFYDFPDGRLAAKNLALRLRTVRRRSWITLKGPARKSRSFKIREEFESEVRDPAGFRRILKALGLRIVFQYRKRRTLFRQGRLRISLDETSVGKYVEIEGRRSDIVKFAKSLGYARKDFVVLDYVRMILDAGRKTEIS